MIFVGFFSIFGVVAYGLAISAVVDKVIEYFEDQALAELLEEHLQDDLKLLDNISDNQTDHEISKNTYTRIQLLKMKRVDMDDLEVIDKKWDQMDVDKGGTISRDELMAYTHFEMADEDDSGVLEMEEFIKLMLFMTKRLPEIPQPKAPLTWADKYAKFDLDHDGQMTQGEFINFWRQLRHATDRGLTYFGQTQLSEIEAASTPDCDVCGDCKATKFCDDCAKNKNYCDECFGPPHTKAKNQHHRPKDIGVDAGNDDALPFPSSGGGGDDERDPRLSPVYEGSFELPEVDTEPFPGAPVPAVQQLAQPLNIQRPAAAPAVFPKRTVQVSSV